jgi:hypothetical protein
MAGPATSSKVGGKSTHPTLFQIPIEVRYCIPLNVSADCGQVCRCDDGCDYVIKDGKTGGSVPATPHSEWFCTELANMIGIASPECKIVTMSDGTFAFGSRWEGGVIKPLPGAAAGGNWWEKVKSGDIKLDDIKATLSRIYAFDHFIHNTDRHCNNFIARSQHAAGVAILANDYSRAWLCCGFPLPSLPMNSATVSAQRWLKSFWACDYIDKDESKIALDRLRAVTVEAAKRIIEGHPEDWLQDAERDAILMWWGSKLMLERLDGIYKGIEDGSYL